MAAGLGTLVFLMVTAVVRGVVEQRGAEVGAGARAETRVLDVAFDLERQSDALVDRLATIHGRAMSQVADGEPLPRYWNAVRAVADVAPGETLILADPSGEVLAMAGSDARSTEDVQRQLRMHAVVGRSGGAGVRAGVVAATGNASLAVSIPIERSSDGVERSTGIPGTRARLALVSPSGALASRGAEHGQASIWPLRGDAVPERFEHVPAALWRCDGAYSERFEGGARAFQALEDASGRHTFLIVAEVREAAGGVFWRAATESLVWELLAAFVAIGLTLRVIKARLVEPIEDLERHASRLTRTEHGKLAFHLTDRGEVGALSDTLDQMLHKIQADRSEFVKSARIAGMSDVSMGVVHSAGNILNSVNVSTKLLTKELAAIGIPDLRAMICELDEHKESLTDYVMDDPNGRFLIPFLSAMTDSLCDLQTRCMLELEAVDDGVAHVINLIKSQEKYAIGASVIETTVISDVIEQALSIASLANDRSSDIKIERAYGRIRDVRIDRHKLTSVLINIIANAIEALAVDGVKDPRLELALYPMTDDRFVIEILDTGVGISPDNLDAIFTSSFSTKKNSPGQGLHTTANLCNELGIAIGVVSEGVGLGCTFKLRVPYSPPESAEDSRASEPRSNLVDGFHPALPKREGNGTRQSPEPKHRGAV